MGSHLHNLFDILVAFATILRHGLKWVTIATSRFLLSNDFIELYLQSIYSTLYTILQIFDNVIRKQIALLFSLLLSSFF